jgi:hypothetical protein
MAGPDPAISFTRHPDENRGPASSDVKVKLDSGFRRKDDGEKWR